MPASMSDSSVQLSTVAVVGLGKIGLPLAVQYARKGYQVIGCDVNEQVVQNLNQGKTHIQEEGELALEIPCLVQQGYLSATTQTTDAVRRANVVVVIVPVLIDAAHTVDFQHIDAATMAIGAGLQSGTLVIYETTLPVGTTSSRLRSLLERTSGLYADQDFYLAYSPERVSSGTVFRDLSQYPKVISGIGRCSTARAAAFYRSVLEAEIITMASTDEAEFVKLIETTYRDVNIALANEFARYADSHGLNVRSAIAAANTQPYSHIHTPGVGVGGHCIPVYPYFLFANPFDEQEDIQEDDMLTLPRKARRINDSMAEYAVQRIERVVGSLSCQSVLILGVAYRGDVRETAFTSARLLQQALLRHGASVYVDDPYFSIGELQAQGYTPLPSGYEHMIDVIILQCNHRAFQNFDFCCASACKVILDGRQALCRKSIEALGIHYITIGDGEYKCSGRIHA
ncbi:nucleotide sugar dehydrogenase [Dictyobacter formicarum]|uniref:Nucleotide sugar dehydrogenase n=1 Tax=Dictyobacter formicarum TaxID=2778368 RepID=A0ABQ3V9Y7_9CHLR|nr:nucleotide sugar dehydrogenase [Dictyobacter formicarum]GHO82750.1 nucleotide sugar dehydrogenase [Dictyobacter formicarum]